jgi:ADP-heptose:LPS heptosyltransferase
MGNSLTSVERGLGPDPATVSHLVVLCPGGLGTMIRAVPALRHLRRTYTDARLSVVIDSSVVDLLESCPFVDRCIDNVSPSEALIERFDLAISLADPDPVEPFLSSWNSIRLAAIDATVRAAWEGVESPDAVSISLAWPRRLSHASRMLRLAWLLGGEHPDPRLTVWPRLADRNGAAKLVDVEVGDRPLALVHVSSRVSEDGELIDAFARLGTTFDALGCATALVGMSADDIDLSAAVGAFDWRGKTSAGVLAALMERSVLFVGTEAGPAVLARSLGIQSVVVGTPDVHERDLLAGRVAWIRPGAGRITADGLLAHSTRAVSRAVDEWNRTRFE